jgi:hypothetical protein
MPIQRWSLVVGIMLTLAAASACSFTTANISQLQLSKDRRGTTEDNTFAPTDDIYAGATVSNVPSKVTLKFRLITEDVEGQPKNAPAPGFDKSFELEKSDVVVYSLNPSPEGWPVGKYRIDVTMHIESGEQKDQETATFTVSR